MIMLSFGAWLGKFGPFPECCVVYGSFWRFMVKRCYETSWYLLAKNNKDVLFQCLVWKISLFWAIFRGSRRGKNGIFSLVFWPNCDMKTADICFLARKVIKNSLSAPGFSEFGNLQGVTCCQELIYKMAFVTFFGQTVLWNLIFVFFFFT